MSKLSELIKENNEKEITHFFGTTRKVSNQYFKFNRIIDSDTIVVLTNNVRIINKNLVLIVGNNQVVYLKDWQCWDVDNADLGLQTTAVRLNRNYFKIYTFKSEFEDVHFETPDTFDTLLETAKEQQAADISVKACSNRNRNI